MDQRSQKDRIEWNLTSIINLSPNTHQTQYGLRKKYLISFMTGSPFNPPTISIQTNYLSDNSIEISQFSPHFLLTCRFSNYQPALRYRTTSGDWGMWRLAHASTETCETNHLNLLLMLLNTFGGNSYLPCSTYSTLTPRCPINLQCFNVTVRGKKEKRCQTCSFGS